MPRLGRAAPFGQMSLGLELEADACSEAALRAVYRRLELSRRKTFEQALSSRAFAIGVRNVAGVLVRRINASRPR
jgi:hypothetical protein